MEGDEGFEKTKMCFSRQNAQSLAWPVKASGEVDWNTLNLGDELNVEEKTALFAVPKRFRKSFQSLRSNLEIARLKNTK